MNNLQVEAYRLRLEGQHLASLDESQYIASKLVVLRYFRGLRMATLDSYVKALKTKGAA